MDSYANLKTCLNRGFLTKTYKMELGEKSFTFVLKNVTSSEIHKNRYFFPPYEGDSRRRGLYLKTCVVALGIVALNGHNYLTQRPEGFRKLIPFLDKLSPLDFDSLLSHVIHLNKVYEEQKALVPVFSDKPYSRQLWSSIKNGISLCSREWTGWPGSESLGLSSIHISWTHMQTILDKFDEVDSMWSVATVLAASQSKDLHRYMVNEGKRRASLRRNMGLNVFGEQKRYAHGVSVNKTVQDLLDEIDREERGEWDEHDLAVQRFEESFLDEYLESQKKMAENISKGNLFDPSRDIQSTSAPISLGAMKRRDEERKRRMLEVGQGKRKTSDLVLDGNRIERK